MRLFDDIYRMRDELRDNWRAYVIESLLAPAVGLAMFLMVVLDLEHPPAAGTALGTGLGGYTAHVVVTILVAVLILAIFHHFCQRWMHDLV